MNISRGLCKSLRAIQVYTYCPSSSPYLAAKLIDRRTSTCNEVSRLCLRSVSTVEGKSLVKEDSILNRFLNKLPLINVKKSRLEVAGFLLYESIVDHIDYIQFFKEFSLPDTFYSWFAVTELHIWMLMVRCMAEGDEGRKVRNRIVSALWTDVGVRVKKIGAANPSGMKYQVAELSEQFQAALLAYDEGLQTDDTVLASTLWRRMYQQRNVDPENLDHLVKYIRKQMRILDNLTREDMFFSKKHVIWESPFVK